MAARANLNVDPSVQEAFLRGQETKDVRIFKIKIVDESLVIDTSIPKADSASKDFDTLLLNSLVVNEAALFLFCLTDNAVDVSKWLLVAWIPEGCRVRDKMLYSSSKDDLKRTLGYGYFENEYAANEKADISWSQYQSSLQKGFDATLLSEAEKLNLEERTLNQGESTKSKASAMGVLPFEFTPESHEQIENFKNGKCNWLELTLVTETVKLLSAKMLTDLTELSSHVNPDVATFIAIKIPKSTGQLLSFFIFSCPENVNVRSKMTMSSAKASVVAAAEQKGVKFDKTLEIRGADEIDDLLRTETDDAGALDVAHGLDSVGGSSAANISHAKPTRPGRGRAKVSKFKADDA